MKASIFLLFFFPSTLFAQCADSPADMDDDSISHLLNLFMSLDLVVGPELYNAEQDSDLEYIIFSQDTVFTQKQYRGTVHAVIDRSDDKSLYYCIGSIGNYLIRDFVIGINMTKGYADGREEEVFLPLHLDEIPLPLNDYEYATYGIDVELYWAYGEGMSN